MSWCKKTKKISKISTSYISFMEMIDPILKLKQWSSHISKFYRKIEI
ncbi:hypothetical protein LEP1GSC170_0453, partial [Leptospira interrogans serovar Bataviae str. HAI135]